MSNPVESPRRICEPGNSESFTPRSTEPASAVDSIERYSFGQQSGLSLKRTEEHLLLCAECRERVDEFEMLTAIRVAHAPLTMTNGDTHVFV
jgi:hypothetical protein